MASPRDQRREIAVTIGSGSLLGRLLATLYASGTQNQPMPPWSDVATRFDTRSTGRHDDPDGQQPGGGQSSVVASHAFTQMLLTLSVVPPTVTHSIELEHTPSRSPPHGPFTCS